MAYILFLSFNIMFVRCIHVVVLFVHSYCCSVFYGMHMPQWIYLFYSVGIWAVPISSYCNQCCHEHSCVSLWWIYEHISVGYVLGMEILGYVVMNMARFNRSYYLFKVVVLITFLQGVFENLYWSVNCSLLFFLLGNKFWYSFHARTEIYFILVFYFLYSIL